MDTQTPAATSYSSAEMTALAHYYRGEMHRANTWRIRLDTTTNWAIITTAAFLSFGFGNENITHFVIILATVFDLFFLIIEARRYKYYDLWRWRVALMNENLFAPVINRALKPLRADWRELLGAELQHSRFKISYLEAFGRRLRRNYGWIFVVLALCWLTKISIHPTPIESLHDIVERAAIFHLVPGWVVIAVGVVFNGLLFAIAVGTMKQRREEVRIAPSERSKIKLSNI